MKTELFILIIVINILTRLKTAITIPLIAKRVGKKYIVAATGIFFFVSQILTSIMGYVSAMILSTLAKIKTVYYYCFMLFWLLSILLLFFGAFVFHQAPFAGLAKDDESVINKSNYADFKFGRREDFGKKAALNISNFDESNY